MNNPVIVTTVIVQYEGETYMRLGLDVNTRPGWLKATGDIWSTVVGVEELEKAYADNFKQYHEPRDTPDGQAVGVGALYYQDSILHEWKLDTAWRSW